MGAFFASGSRESENCYDINSPYGRMSLGDGGERERGRLGAEIGFYPKFRKFCWIILVLDKVFRQMMKKYGEKMYKIVEKYLPI